MKEIISVDYLFDTLTIATLQANGLYYQAAHGFENTSPLEAACAAFRFTGAEYLSSSLKRYEKKWGAISSRPIKDYLRPLALMENGQEDFLRGILMITAGSFAPFSNRRADERTPLDKAVQQYNKAAEGTPLPQFDSNDSDLHGPISSFSLSIDFDPLHPTPLAILYEKHLAGLFTPQQIIETVEVFDRVVRGINLGVPIYA